MFFKLSVLLVITALMFGCSPGTPPLHHKTIVLDPGHGDTDDTDQYRVGPTGEREEWINLRVALKLQQLLEESGANVLMTRTEDLHVELADRAKLAVENDADLFLSIHHNAIADTAANFPIVYFHGYVSENQASVQFARQVASQLRYDLFGGDGPAVVASDHTIFPTSGTAVLRHSYGIPGVISEASFFTHPAEEERLKDPDYNQLEAESLYRAIRNYFEKEPLPIHEKQSRIELPPFDVFQAAERMSPEGLRWKENFKEAQRLLESGEPDELKKAYEQASESVRAFADSPKARAAHLLRAEALDRLGRNEDAKIARLRAEEFYVEIDRQMN
jgi:N-acetylmuramoyl-L-alanine amidase